MKTRFSQLNYFYFISYLFVFPTFLFARSFMGIKVNNLRLGEILVAVSFIFAFYQIFEKRSFIKFFGERVYISYALLTISVLLSVIFRQGPLLDSYVYKSSSNIWLMSNIFLCFKFFNKIKIEKSYLFALNFLLFFSYIFSVIYYPNFLKEFFVNYSDKFDYLKASDILILFVAVIFLNNRFLPIYFKYTFEINLLISSIFFPLFIFKSRGSAIAFIIFFVLEVLKFKNVKKFSFIKKIIFTLLFAVFFNISAYFIVDIKPDDENIVTSTEVVYELLENKNTNLQNFLSLYLIQNIDDLDSFNFLNNGRLFSTDGNINWRLQIWQDVLLQSFDNFQYLFGVGYTEKIPVMNNPLYVGSDGTNEYVHNYFVNIYARGGLVQLILFLNFYIQLIKFSNYKLKNNDILNYVVPLIVVSLFDSSMSNPHFPFLFFLCYGQILIIMNNKVKEV